jgi:aconitate hydratase
MNYLASPPLCVAYALAGRMDLDIVNEPLQNDVYLRDIWPTQQEVNETIERAIESDMFRRSYGDALFEGDDNWKALEIPEGDRYAWDDESTYVKQPPYFEDMPADAPEGFEQIEGARAIAVLGDSVTTDHISPAGAIKKDSPGGQYLVEHGVEPREFNSYGSRRGNHEVMMRGTFANIRLRNQLAPGTEGGVTRHLPDGEEMSIYDAAVKYAEEGVPLVVLGGEEYGSGSSRDWAAKGTNLLGVKAVIANSFERIHRSNLVGMGVLPLQADTSGLTGDEELTITGVADALNAGELPRTAKVRAGDTEFEARVRIDTPKEAEYFRHGGILQYVLRSLLGDER